MKALRIWLQGQWAATSRSGWFVLWPPHTVTVYDGHTLKDALGQVQRIAGENPEHAFVDMGNRGMDTRERLRSMLTNATEGEPPKARGGGRNGERRSSRGSDI